MLGERRHRFGSFARNGRGGCNAGDCCNQCCCDDGCRKLRCRRDVGDVLCGGDGYRGARNEDLDDGHRNLGYRSRVDFGLSMSG